MHENGYSDSKTGEAFLNEPQAPGFPRKRKYNFKINNLIITDFAEEGILNYFDGQKP